jgi:ribonuclease E
VVRTVPSGRPEATAAAAPAEAAGGRRRRGGRGGRSAENAEGTPVVAPPGALAPGETPDTPRPEPEAGGRRQELDYVAVPMDAEQEEVYGWMGFNPALLLDPPPSGENLVMRVVRPGCDPEVVLEEARQQASAAGSRRRRRGGRGGEGRASASEAAPGSAEADGEAEDRLPPVPLAIPADIVTVELPARRRISAGGGALDAATPSPEPPASEAPDDGEDEANADPRRRRRRSSASV